MQLKIAQVMALYAEDGSYGGPMSVALEQAAQLGRLGHDVSVFAAAHHPESKSVGDYALRTFPITARLPGGAAQVVSVRALTRAVGLRNYDIVHVHMGRDPVTLPTALVASLGAPVVLQTHGMVMPDRRLRARIINPLTRKALARASAIIYLTEHEKRGLCAVGAPPRKMRRLGNGVSLERGSPSLVWSDRVSESTVLFCARLHPRKMVGAFLAMADIVSQTYPATRFVIAGPDEGDLHLVLSHPGPARISYEGAVSRDRALSLIARSDVFVLPSVDEPFPMAVLEAMSLGTACVVTSQTGISAELKAAEAALVVEPVAEALSRAVGSLIGDSALATKLQTNARELVERRFSISAVCDRLVDIYADIVSGHSATP